MIFLTLDDLKAHSFERYINDSSADFVDARDVSELQNISLIKSKISSRFDVNAIFGAGGANRHPLIVRVLSLLVIYDLINRNKARKVPKDAEAAYQWALDWLDDVRNNLENPDLPALTNDDGSSQNSPIWGNNRRDDFYI